MNLIILAAGKGMRLDGHSQGLPKSLLPVQGDVSCLQLQLCAFNKFRFQKKIIVGGFAIEQLQAFLTGNGFDDYLLIKNPEYEKGNLYSLRAALPEVTGDFFVFNADHYYSSENYKKIFSADRTGHITIFCDQDRVLQHDDMKIEILSLQAPQSGAWQSVFKKMSKEKRNSQIGYVGVTRVPANKIPVYREACQQTEKLLGDKAHVENALNWLAENGEEIRVMDISGSWWVEIDTPEDLKKAQKILFDK